MKQFFLFISCFITVCTISAQSPSLEWVKGIIETGSGEVSNIISYSVAVDASGNVYTTGNFTDTVDFDPGPGVYNLTTGDADGDMFISKLDALGNFVWAKRINGAGSAFSAGSTIKIDPAGNVYVIGSFSGILDFDPGVGTTNLISAGGKDIFILKLDIAGNFSWVKRTGGASDDFGASLVLDGSGNIYATGNFSGIVDFDPGAGVFNLASSGGVDAYISKLDASGNFIWAKRVGGTSDDYIGSIVLDTSDNIYVTGEFNETVDFNPGAGVYDLTCTGTVDEFILKLDVSGNFVWAKCIDGGNTYRGSIAVDAMQNVYTTGWYYGTVDFDPGSGIFNLPGEGENMFISKLNSSGDFVWAKGTAGLVDGVSIATDILNNVYTTGYFADGVDFDPGPDTFILTYPSAIAVGMFISKLDADGNFRWAVAMDGMSSGYSITVDTSFNVYTTGYFTGTTDFDPGTGVADLTCYGPSAFVHKMSGIPLGINEYKENSDIVVYPNPATDQITTEFINQSELSILEIKNVLGQTIYSEPIKDAPGKQNKNIDIAGLSNGIYFLQLKSKDKINSKKFVKE